MSDPPDKKVADLRHDLRNQLSSVRNAMFYIRRKVETTEVYASDPRLPYFFEIVESSITRAGALVEASLDASTSFHPSAGGRGRERFLLVEDDESNGLTLSALFEDEGFEVDLARSAAEARSRLVSAPLPFDVVVLDHDLGDGLGTDLVPLVRECAPWAAVVLMSGSESEALDLARADARFMKGDPPQALLDAIGVLLRGTYTRPRTSRPSITSMDPKTRDS